MIKHNGRDDRLDAFLGSVIEPAAAEYAEAMIDAAQNPRYSMPPELDKRCLERINGSSTSVRRSLRTILIAAVIAALLGTSAFAVYNEVRQGLVMKREDVDEGSRIMFAGMDDEMAASDTRTPAALTLNYIPDGFEIVYRDEQTVKYKDNNGRNFVVDKTNISKNYAITLDTEGEEVNPFVYKEYEGYNSVGEYNGQSKISYLWYDAGKKMVYKLMAVGLDENEVIKILDGMDYES